MVSGAPLLQRRNSSVHLLVSPTRSSYVVVTCNSESDSVVAKLNGEDFIPEDESVDVDVSALAALRPWRHAASIDFDCDDAARRASQRISQASGFRARVNSLRCLLDSQSESNPVVETFESHPTRQCGPLDGLTYVYVELANPAKTDKWISVRALVDTGSEDCDLRQSFIRQLGLPLNRSSARVETAAGRRMEMALYRASLRVLGREVDVLVSPADEVESRDAFDEEFGFPAVTDDAVLGHSALALLGLQVDCCARSLVEVEGANAVRSQGRRSMCSDREGGCTYAMVEFVNPEDPTKSLVVRALVDTGASDCDLRQRFIDKLSLPRDLLAGNGYFETANGVSTESHLYRAVVRVAGRESVSLVSPVGAGGCAFAGSGSGSDAGGSDDEDSADSDGDDALLGHDALASLGLRVDCRSHRLVPV